MTDEELLYYSGYSSWDEVPKFVEGDSELRIDTFEWARWQHPRTEQLLQHLMAVDFADRYDALCHAHPVRGDKVPVGLRKQAIANVGRPMYWSQALRRFVWREAWVDPSGLPELTTIGLDIKIDARVELELLLVTPDGHLSAAFPRYLKQIRQRSNPTYKHNNPAPRIASPEELPGILAEALALYDDIAAALKADRWWAPTPKPWLYDERGQKTHEPPAGVNGPGVTPEARAASTCSSSDAAAGAGVRPVPHDVPAHSVAGEGGATERAA